MRQLWLKSRLSDMQGRLDRLQDRASKRRQIAKDVMVELDLKKLTAPDFTASIRSGMPTLVVLNEDAVPKTYWEPGEPRLRRQVLACDLKGAPRLLGLREQLVLRNSITDHHRNAQAEWR
jgi:hypothetical protein